MLYRYSCLPAGICRSFLFSFVKYMCGSVNGYYTLSLKLSQMLSKKHNKSIEEIKCNMKESVYKNYDDLPLFLNAAIVAQVLGISAASSYELMHEKDFPVLKIGNRMVVPKEKFIAWVEQNTNGGNT